MRSYEIHVSPKQVQRSSGRSSVAAAAYRSASRLVDERTAEIHDYSRKSGVEHTRLYVPANAPEWARDRQALWNAAEKKENRSNSVTAREFEVAFPAEFNAMQRREAGDKIAREIIRRFGCAVDIAYHKPSSGGDERNYHAHILYTTRAFDPSTKDGWSKNKYRDMNKDKTLDPVTNEPTTKISVTVRQMRAFMAAEMNRIAQRDNLRVKTEHLSLEARGIDREPTQHLGPHASQMERRGEPSRIGNDNRAIAERNSQRATNERDLSQANSVIALHRADFDTWKHEKRAELRHAHELTQLDLSRKHDRQRSRQAHEINKTYGEAEQLIKTKVNIINLRLLESGVKKSFRDLVGKSAQDRQDRRLLMATLRDIRQRQNEQRQALAAQQTQERKSLEIKQQKQRDRLETSLATGKELDRYGWRVSKPRDPENRHQSRTRLRLDSIRARPRTERSQRAVDVPKVETPTATPSASPDASTAKKRGDDNIYQPQPKKPFHHLTPLPEPKPTLDLQPKGRKSRTRPRPQPAPQPKEWDEPDLSDRKNKTELRLQWETGSKPEKPKFKTASERKKGIGRGLKRSLKPSPDGGKDEN